jgi:hypothetical protein
MNREEGGQVYTIATYETVVCLYTMQHMCYDSLFISYIPKFQKALLV